MMDIDVSKLREEFFQWKKGVSMAALQEQKSRQECVALREEREHLACQLRRAQARLQVMGTKLRELTQNYAAVAPVIGTKNRLAREVTQLREEFSQAEKSHSKKVRKLKDEVDAVRREGEEKMLQALEQERTKAKEAAEKATASLKEKEEQLQSVRQDLDDERKNHERVLEDLRKTHHDEQEKLQMAMARLQQNLSSRSTSNMDLFANKLQATVAEFEEQLRERDSKLTQVEEELRQTREALGHQRLLSVIRDVATTASTPTPTPATSPSVSITSLNTPEVVVIDDNKTDLNESVDDGQSSGGRRPHNRTQPVRHSKGESSRPLASRTRLGKKRKLYSGKSFLLEDGL